MNPSNQTGATQTGSFPSQQSSQTNPFTADLKGEFTSNFGTNTNAVSQIFKDGGFVSNNNTKYIAIAAIVLAAGLGLFFYMTSEDSEQISFDGETTADGEKKVDPAAAPTTEATDASATGTTETATTEQAAPAAETQQAAAPTGPITLGAPADGEGRAYDETSGPAEFSWQGGGGTIVFARSQSMKPEYMRVPVSGSSYKFYNPYPGTWFWRVDAGDGSASEVRRFTVDNPVKRNVNVTEPASGGTLAGSGGVVAWTGDAKVAFYRVEFSADGNWNTPTHRFATSAERIQTSGVAAGSYQMRVGAFSEVAGRWEYTAPASVTVQ